VIAALSSAMAVTGEDMWIDTYQVPRIDRGSSLSRIVSATY
jgi:hypothetical protein